MSTPPRPRPEKLRLARKFAGATQEEWAATLGVSVFHIGLLERNKRHPSGALLRRYARASRKTIEWFYTEAA